MKNTKLRKAVKSAEDKMNAFMDSIDKIGEYLKFSGFDEQEKPTVSYCGDYSIILRYCDYEEMNIEEAIGYMETRGYIIPEDFFKNK